MAIIISENGKNADRIEESQFGLEDKLQQYIYDNPDAIPLYDIDQDTRLFIAAREFSTKSGPIDALGFDASGNIYVVETKLYKNPDKRTVVAQALDYGASLWRHSVDFDSFLAQLDSHCQKQFGVSFKQKYSEFFDLDDTTEQFELIRSNLADGSIKFVVLMDKLHDALKDLVVFVNQNSKFDLYAVELEYYVHKSFEIIIPKLFGAEVKKDVSSSNTKSRPQYTPTDHQAYLDSINRFVSLGTVSKDQFKTLMEFSELSKLIAEKTGGRVLYLHKKSSTRDVVAELLEDSDQRITLYADSDANLGFYMWGKSGVQIDIIQELLNALVDEKLMQRTEKHKTATQWFINLNDERITPKEIEEFLLIYKDIIKKHLP